MSLINDCPDCGSQLSHQAERCRCGWVLIKETTTKIDKSKCHYFVNGVQCNELGSVGISIRCNEWYCSAHAAKLRKESYLR